MIKSLAAILIIHIIRTAKIPFIHSRASPALITTTIIICVVGIFAVHLGRRRAGLHTVALALLAARRRHAVDLRSAHAPDQSVVRSQVGRVMQVGHMIESLIWCSRPVNDTSLAR
jgi:hypothetical protein